MSLPRHRILISSAAVSLIRSCSDREEQSMATAADRQAKIGVLGASGYTGAELVRLLHPPSRGRDRAAHRRSPRRAGDAPGVSAVLAVRAAEAAIDRGHGLGGRRPRSDLLRLAPCHHAEGDPADRRRAARDQDRRPLGRLPAVRPRRLCALVRPRASCARAAAARGVRPGRGLSRRDQARAARRQSRLLHDLRRASAHSAAAGQARSIPTRS